MQKFPYAAHRVFLLPVGDDTKEIEENHEKELVYLSTHTAWHRQSVAAGCIYLVSHICKLKINKREVHLACNVSEVTIR